MNQITAIENILLENRLHWWVCVYKTSNVILCLQQFIMFTSFYSLYAMDALSPVYLQ